QGGRADALDGRRGSRSVRTFGSLGLIHGFASSGVIPHDRCRKPGRPPLRPVPTEFRFENRAEERHFGLVLEAPSSVALRRVGPPSGISTWAKVGWLERVFPWKITC